MAKSLKYWTWRHYLVATGFLGMLLVVIFAFTLAALHVSESDFGYGMRIVSLVFTFLIVAGLNPFIRDWVKRPFLVLMAVYWALIVAYNFLFAYESLSDPLVAALQPFRVWSKVGVLIYMWLFFSKVVNGYAEEDDSLSHAP